MKTLALTVSGILLGLALAAPVRAEPGSWKQVGKAGDWRGTIAATTLLGRLYTIEENGALYETNLATGAWKPLGKPDFANTTLLVAADKALYTIETDGSLYRVSPVDGSWEGVGAAGDWRGTVAGAVLRGQLYTIEENGALYETNLGTGAWKPLGKPDFANTEVLVATDKLLCTIESDGNLYRVDPADGSWAAVGAAGAWKGTIAGTVLGGRLYTIEKSGALYETDLGTGAWKQLGKLDFVDTEFLVATDNLLYTLETDGTLYEVSAK